ncbi:DUF808 domain-containing protein [Marihabitans asiaticum]|uniref:Inner membrane protein YedI n=1 Tax=Marihabitans asiaticum TaxID=415218 RepID=A0A560WCV0_9MICO|nr:DUF808 domain-containing protein [Marihabitans asiaticum]TWD14252.1 hypothetical protein FB557_1657 [Marihabitans asiaticum]TWD15422.1 hypothetical protein FB557_0932 [Marihabitans asiaticum]
MSGGLFALLDDIAAMARLAAASVDDVAAAAGRASAKSAGVVVDDTAVTPQYLEGVDPSRELPMIKKIAIGSIRNKLIFILPAALLLSQFVPGLISPILMLGGSYLCFEGAEKIWGKISGHDEGHAEPVASKGDASAQEDEVTSNAIRTDFILSAEIMIIALKEVADEGFVSRAVILAVVAVLITLAVYGVVALIVKMDDVGLHLAQKELTETLGQGMVKAMPKVLAAIGVIGTVAMLWVGGHIILVGLEETHWLPQPYEWVHHLEEQVAGATGALGGVLGWLTNTFFSFLLGLAWGAVLVAIWHVLPFGKDKHGVSAEARAEGASSH